MRPRRSIAAKQTAALAIAALGAAGLVGAGGVALPAANAQGQVAAQGQPTAQGAHHAVTKAKGKKYTVSLRLPVKASTAKRKIKVSFSPKKPTKVKLQQWKKGKYVTIRTAKKPKGKSTTFRFTPPKGKTKLRAVAIWKKSRAVTPGRTTTWSASATSATTAKRPAGTPPGVLDANGDPTVNLGEPAALNACWSYGATDSRCRNAAVSAINLGRTREGLAHFTLPSNWTALSAAQQLLVISNDERKGRGLRQISRLSGPLNVLAMTGASTNSDPLLTSWTVEGKQAYGWASNWAITPGGPLYSNYLWMYDDGLGSGNIHCTTTNRSGCWGHRHNILAFGEADSSTSLVLGAAETRTTWAGWSGLSDATLLVKLAA